MRKPLAVTLAALSLWLGVAATAHAQWTWTPETGRWVNQKRLPKETAELQLEYARSLLVEGNYKRALRETDKFSDFYSESDLADENQFVRGEVRMAQGKYDDAAKDFQQVVTAYPDTDLFDEVIAKQYEIGDRFYEKGQRRESRRFGLFAEAPYKKAITVYNMVIENQPFTPAAAEAQYKVGLCHFAREEYIEAAYEYRRVVEDYSSSDWVDDASYGLAQTYYVSALPPEYDQTTSGLAVEAVDEFKARFPGDERTTELDGKRGEMVERMAKQKLQTAKFYEKRREFTSARLCYEAVLEQFPQTESAEQAKTWLAENPLNPDDPSAFMFPKASGS